MAFKKKLHAFRPNGDPLLVETKRTTQKQRSEPCDPASLERGVRQLLADKLSGTMVGIWLLIPEHLRLGTWDLLCGWTGQSSKQVQPRLALQSVHEAALCVSGVREGRSLSQKGFEVANGLPFVATDQAIHDLFEAQSIDRTQSLQITLGQLRRASGHFQGRLLAVDPHRLRSYSKRQMPRRCHREGDPAVKALQTFFCFDVETQQPIASTIGSAARTVSQATPQLLDMATRILHPKPGTSLVLADNEHLTADLFEYVHQHSCFDLLCPMTCRPRQQKKLAQLPDEVWTTHWAGMATACLPYQSKNFRSQPLYQLVQRCGETPDNYHYKSFLSTTKRDELDQLCCQYPQRWHVEEFFNTYQAMGWKRAGTLNLHIRYAQLTMAFIAQAAVQQLRQRLGEPFDQWEARHLGQDLFKGLEGDVRVIEDT
ncbi:MAG: transposase, partial [Chloroflexota bacterium]|nr:transposase [Chloroflexota bacterium]